MPEEYSDSDSGDDVAHDELLKEIKYLDQPTRENKKNLPKVSLKPKVTEKVDFNDLLGSIQSTRNLNELKKKLVPSEESKKKARRQETGKDKIEIKVVSQKRKGVLDAPLHRQAKGRIESEIAYKASKQELRAWNPIVHSYRVAEQICFPLGEEKSVHIVDAEDKATAFQPRTELERLTAEVLGKSKYNIKNKEAYSEAEKEIIKAMSLSEAKRKCSELQKMRALMSYKAAKLKQQSKIKSKQYHRIKKRQKHRDLIKEIEGLMVQDPEKATEKLGELEKDRAFERGTLKHRAIKWDRHIKKFASKNPELRKLMEDHLRFGRELKSQHGLHDEADDSANDNDSDNSDEIKGNIIPKKLTVGEIVKMAVEQADRESEALKPVEQFVETAKVNPFYRSALENLRREQKMVLKSASKIEKYIELDKPGAIKSPGIVDKKKDRFIPKTKQTKRKDSDRPRVIITEKISNAVADLQPRDVLLPVTNDFETFIQQPNNTPSAEAKLIQPKISTKAGGIIQAVENYLELDKPGAIEENFLSEAYENDSVLGDFEEEKQRVEDEEKPEALDLTLHGWGSWTGPGIVDKKKDRFILKPKETKRKDSDRPRVIIREKISNAVSDLQPRDVPFPFTSVKDFETFIQQPLGRDWNTPSAQAKLIQPKISTKAGRIIRAVDKDEKNKHNVAQHDSDSDYY